MVDHPAFIVSSFIENSIGHKSVYSYKKTHEPQCKKICRLGSVQGNTLTYTLSYIDYCAYRNSVNNDFLRLFRYVRTDRTMTIKI